MIWTIFHLRHGSQETENLIWTLVTLTTSIPLVVYFFLPFLGLHFLFICHWVGSGISESQNAHLVQSGNLNRFSSIFPPEFTWQELLKVCWHQVSLHSVKSCWLSGDILCVHADGHELQRNLQNHFFFLNFWSDDLRFTSKQSLVWWFVLLIKSRHLCAL